MTKQNIIITGFEDSEDKSRTRFQTNKGWMSAFKNEGETLITDLKQHVETLISVDTMLSKQLNKSGEPYVNIRKYFGVSDGDDEEQPKTEFKPEKKSTMIESATEAEKKERWGLREYEKCPVGLSVEIFNTTYNPEDKATSMEMRMGECIRLVKQAREAF